MPVKRISKRRYYLNLAKEVASRSTCLRSCYGAVIVNNDEIISTGYNGAPRGRKNCNECGFCLRNEIGLAKGERYELCRSVHAEMNAIIAGNREAMQGATLYLSGFQPDNGELIKDMKCCDMCIRIIINSGIKQVIYDNGGDGLAIDVENFILMDDSIPTRSDMLKAVDGKDYDKLLKLMISTEIKLPYPPSLFDDMREKKSYNRLVSYIYHNALPSQINEYYKNINYIE